MQLTLIRKWGERANYFILAGDDDQTIFSFTGASPDAILDPDIPEDHKIILKQSHRVPRAVHQLANDLIHRVTRRQEKVYLPRPEDGAVQRLSRGTYKSPEYFILKSAMEHLEQGKTVMFLASCSYMLHPLVAILRKNGIPFHNPYRKTNGFWNPLRIGTKGSSANRILSLLVAHPEFGDGHRAWTKRDLALWSEWLESKGILRSGAKEIIQTCAGSHLVTMEHLRRRSSNRGHSNPCWQHGMAITVRCSTGGEPESLRTSVIASSFRQTLPPCMGRARSWICPKWWSGPSTPSREAKPMWSISFRTSARPGTLNTTGAARRAIP